MMRARAGEALRTAAFLLSLLSMIAGVAGLYGCRRALPFHGEVVDPAQPAPELAGVNWDGKPYRLSGHRGQVVVVFFGYTFCPDVCPFTLAKMKQLYGRLGRRAGDVEVVFVSVDPQRDSVEKLAQYVPSFDRRFFGLHLEPAELANVAKGFDVAVQYGDPKAGLETNTFYYVDHTATFFVIDRQGKLRIKYPPNTRVDQMLPDIERLLAS